jgi:hypothetical protein
MYIGQIGCFDNNGRFLKTMECVELNEIVSDYGYVRGGG